MSKTFVSHHFSEENNDNTGHFCKMSRYST